MAACSIYSHPRQHNFSRVFLQARKHEYQSQLAKKGKATNQPTTIAASHVLSISACSIYTEETNWQYLLTFRRYMRVSPSPLLPSFFFFFLSLYFPLLLPLHPTLSLFLSVFQPCAHVYKYIPPSTRRTVQNFRSLNSVELRFLCSSETPIHGFLGSKIVNCACRIFPSRRPTCSTRPTLSQLKSLDYLLQFRNVERRILKLQRCERVGRVLLLSSLSCRFRPVLICRQGRAGKLLPPPFFSFSLTTSFSYARLTHIL